MSDPALRFWGTTATCLMVLIALAPLWVHLVHRNDRVIRPVRPERKRRVNLRE